MAYRSKIGRDKRSQPPAELEPLRREAVEYSRAGDRPGRGAGRATGRWLADVSMLVIHPIRFGDEILGTLEVEHHKRHAYGPKDLLAMSTLAGQIATAIPYRRAAAAAGADREPDR